MACISTALFASFLASFLSLKLRGLLMQVSKVALLLATTLVASCAGLAEKPIIINPQGELQGLDYNTLSATYMKRPTFVEYSPSYDTVYIYYKGYGANPGSLAGSTERGFRIEREKAYLVTPHLKKFIEWDDKATAQGLTVSKEIGVEELVTFITYTFEFRNVSPSRNLLFICSGSFGQKKCGFMLDRKSAENLLQLMESIDTVISDASRKSDTTILN